MRTIELLFKRWVVALALFLSIPALGDDRVEQSIATEPSPPTALPAVGSNDALFAPAGHLSTTLSTGLPYVAIGEVAYGFTSRFTLGIVAGVTPDSPGAGLRLRGVLFEKGAERIYVSTLLLYYPASASSNDEPWVLAWPTIQAEHRFNGGATVHAGFGAAAATCTGVIGSLFRYGNFGHDDDDSDKGGFMGDIWLSANVGGAIPIARATSLFADVSVESQGLAFDRHWLGTLPIVVTLGIEHTL
jgi:hypothetical protein